MKRFLFVSVLLVLAAACTSQPIATPVPPTTTSTQLLRTATAITAPTATSTGSPTSNATSTVTSAPTAVPVTIYTPTLPPHPLIPMIDAESEIDDTVNLDKVIHLIQQGEISCTILSTIYNRDTADVISLAAKNPGRIIPAVRIKNRTLELVKQQVDSGQYAAMQESLMYHAQKGDRSPLVVIYPDNPHVQDELNYAISKNWPFIVHIEFRAAGSERDKFMTGLESLLDRNPKHPFVLIHLGQLDVLDVQRLIQTHSNIYFMTSSADPIFSQYGGPNWTNMFDGDHLAPGWKGLMVSYPDRFILAFDRVYPEMWGQMYLDQIALWRKALDELPLDVAHAFAHGNAERLWHLTLSNQDPVPTCSINSR